MIDLTNTKIYLLPEQRKRVQEYAFSKGWEWLDGKVLKLLDAPYLCFHDDRKLSYLDYEDKDFFDNFHFKLIHFTDIFPEVETKSLEDEKQKLAEFFSFFKQNGERFIGFSVEQLIEEYYNEKFKK